MAYGVDNGKGFVIVRDAAANESRTAVSNSLLATCQNGAYLHPL